MRNPPFYTSRNAIVIFYVDKQANFVTLQNKMLPFFLEKKKLNPNIAEIPKHEQFISETFELPSSLSHKLGKT